MGGDLDGLMAVLAPDVVMVSDGGGKAQAARHPILGAAKVARFMLGISGRPYQGLDVADIAVEGATINASAGLLFSAHGRVIAAATVAVDGDRITAIQLVANPDKLRAISAGRSLPM